MYARVCERLMAVVYVTLFCSGVTDQDKWFAIILFTLLKRTVSICENTSQTTAQPQTLKNGFIPISFGLNVEV